MRGPFLRRINITPSGLTAGQTFPNNGSLSLGLQSLVSSLSEYIQSLLKRLSSRVQRRLSLRILVITILIQLVSTSAEVLTREHSRNGCEQIDGELGGVVGSETELTGGRLVGVTGPRGCLSASNVFRVSFGDNGGVAGGVNLDDNVNTTRTGVGDDICNVLGRISVLRRIGTFLGQDFESGNNKGETLAVYDVPMEGVDLR